MFFSAKRRKKRPNLRPSHMLAAPASFSAHARGDQRVVSVSKGVRSAHTQAALRGARTTPSARADANGSKVRRDPPKRCTRLPNVAAAPLSIGAVGACAPSELRVHHHVDSTRIRSVTS